MIKTENPINRLDDDCFERVSYACAIAQALVASETPNAFYLEADWGEGKSSFLNLISHQLKDQVKICHFNAWKFDNEEETGSHLIFSLLAQLSSDEFKPKIEKLLKEIYNSDLLNIRSVQQSITEFILQCNIDKKIVLFIDDLDRAKTKTIVSILNTLANHLLFKDNSGDNINIAIMVALKEERAIDALIQSNEFVDAKNTDQQYFIDLQSKYKNYLRRIFTLFFALPKASISNIKQFLCKHLPNVLDELNDENQNLFIDSLYRIEKNPRNLLNIFNKTLIFNICISSQKSIPLHYSIRWILIIQETPKILVALQNADDDDFSNFISHSFKKILSRSCLYLFSLEPHFTINIMRLFTKITENFGFLNYKLDTLNPVETKSLSKYNLLNLLKFIENITEDNISEAEKLNCLKIIFPHVNNKEIKSNADLVYIGNVATVYQNYHLHLSLKIYEKGYQFIFKNPNYVVNDNVQIAFLIRFSMGLEKNSNIKKALRILNTIQWQTRSIREANYHYGINVFCILKEYDSMFRLLQYCVKQKKYRVIHDCFLDLLEYDQDIPVEQIENIYNLLYNADDTMLKWIILSFKSQIGLYDKLSHFIDLKNLKNEIDYMIHYQNNISDIYIVQNLISDFFDSDFQRASNFLKSLNDLKPLPYLGELPKNFIKKLFHYQNRFASLKIIEDIVRQNRKIYDEVVNEETSNKQPNIVF